MKLLFMPLKVVTEVLWMGAKAARKVVRTARGAADEMSDIAERYAPPRRDMPKAGDDNSQWAEANRVGAAPGRGVADQSEPAEGWRVGDPVCVKAEMKVKRFTVPAGAAGRILSVDDGKYQFLWYTKQGLPVLVPNLTGAELLGY